LLGVGLVAWLARSARRAASVERARRLRTPRTRLPARVREPLERALQRADFPLDPDTAARLWMSTAATAAFCVALVVPAFVVPAVVGAFAAPAVALRWARGRRDAAVVGALAPALDAIAADLRAGGTVPEAVAALAEESGALARDLARVTARSRLGAAFVDALAGWPADRPRGEIRIVAGALAVAARTGGPSAEALESLARSLRDRAAARAEARSLSAQARLSAIVVGAAPLGFLAFSALTDPASVDVLVSTGVGRTCLVAGLVLEALGAMWMRRMATVDLST
jgi:tight adherence protein B